MELTKRFTVKYSVITLPDGSQDTVEYVEEWNHDGSSISFHDITDDAWFVSVYNEPYLKWRRMYEGKTTYSMDNIQKIETTSEREMVAVCEIDEDEFIQQSSSWFGLRSREVYQKPDDFEMPDVTIWNAVEWDEK